MYSPAAPIAVFTPPTVEADGKTREARSRPRPAAESHRDETMPGNALQRSQQTRNVGLNVRPTRCETGSRELSVSYSQPPQKRGSTVLNGGFIRKHVGYPARAGMDPGNRCRRRRYLTGSKRHPGRSTSPRRSLPREKADPGARRPPAGSSSSCADADAGTAGPCSSLPLHAHVSAPESGGRSLNRIACVKRRRHSCLKREGNAQRRARGATGLATWSWGSKRYGTTSPVGSTGSSPPQSKS